MSRSAKQLISRLAKEIRAANPNVAVKHNPVYLFMADQFKRYQVTEEKYCRGQDEMKHMASTYLCLLESIRVKEEISAQYKGEGEKTTEQAAAAVGLKLPENDNT